MSPVVRAMNSASTYVNVVIDISNTFIAAQRAFKLAKKEKLNFYEKISLISNTAFASLMITLTSSKAYHTRIIQTELSPDFLLKMELAISGVDVLRAVSDKLSYNSNSASRWTIDDTLDTLTIILYRTSNSSFLGCTYRPDLCGDKVRNTAYACQSVAVIIAKRKALHFCIIQAIVYSKLILSTKPSEEFNNVRAY